jgi:hypothetical protein
MRGKLQVHLKIVLLALFGAAMLRLPARAEETPRVAVWNPQKGTRESRFELDLPQLDAMAETLRTAGVSVTRVTAEELCDAAAFSAARFDALVLPGDAFPKVCTRALQEFGNQGGVLVALAARIPLLVAIEKQPDGLWTMSPKQPTFAWQSEALLGNVGLHYIYRIAMHDLGTRHFVTPLWKRYQPAAIDPGAEKLPSNFLVPVQDGQIYPLVRSLRMDGADVTPQLYLARRGRAALITGQTDAVPERRPITTKNIAAIARLAKDLHDGKVELTPEMRIDVATVPPEPLRTRLPLGSVEPEKARAVVRWGRFDGSSVEFGPRLAAGRAVRIASGVADKEFPSALEAGASVELVLPPLGPGPHALRIRGAYTRSGAGLKVTQGPTVLWNELFTYIDGGEQGNMKALSIVEVPAEFTRIIFLPPAAGSSSVTLANCGAHPVYFDAVQVEDRTQPTPQMIVGLNGQNPFSGGQHIVNTVPVELSRHWSVIRANIRTQTVLSADQPNRFKMSEAKLDMYLASGAPIELLFEGTAAWSAISPERFKNGGNRSHVVPPDNARYAEIVEHFVKKYGDRIAAYELWNETNIRQFWQGSYEEYAEFFKTMARLIRKLRPNATIITGGMAGYSEPFVRVMQESGALALADRFAFHAYAGKSPAWDITFGMHEGLCFSRGIATELYCNEQGFVWHNDEWFQPPPQFTPAVQADLLNTALARLLANGLAKINIFHAGGDKHSYGLIDENGQPRPAYLVLADYLPLGEHGGRRLDVSMARADGQPLAGVYAAAAAGADGSAVVIVNPAEVETLKPKHPAENPSQEFAKGPGPWITFFGKAIAENGASRITLAQGKTYAGFYRSLALDLDRWPLLEVDVPECAAGWKLLFIDADKKAVALAENQKAGVFRIDLRKALGRSNGRVDGELKFNFSGTTAIRSVRFTAAPDSLPGPAAAETPAQGIPLLLRVPLATSAGAQATATSLGKAQRLEIAPRDVGGVHWVELRLDLSGRTRIEIARPAQGVRGANLRLKSSTEWVNVPGSVSGTLCEGVSSQLWTTY